MKEGGQMKQVAKTGDLETVKRFLDQVYFTGAYETGNTRACITHYCVSNEEVAQVSYNFSSKIYILRLK